MLLRKLLKKNYSSIREMARALDVDSSHLSRAMSKRVGQPFDVRGCLRLARVTGEDPLLVLRAAGKDEIADLMAELMGARAGRLLAPDQIKLLDAHEAIPDLQMRAHVVEMVRRTAAGYATVPNHTHAPRRHQARA
jgi:transcriptional regulator with XRE-family HTH domain